MVLQVSLSHSYTYHYFNPNLSPTLSSAKTHFTNSLPKPNLAHSTYHLQNVSPPSLSRRRSLNLSILAAVLSFTFLPTISKAVLAEEFLELERYIDAKEGFSLLRPSSWIKVDKAGATVLFEEENKGSNNVGVVVNPVRLKNLGDFGNSQFVADKLIQAEKRKSSAEECYLIGDRTLVTAWHYSRFFIQGESEREREESTKDAQVIRVSERLSKGGLLVYEFEYKVDSTRGGMKRIFSAAFVASNKLYILNISHSDKPESPLDSHRRMMLEEILHSFDAAPLT